MADIQLTREEQFAQNLERLTRHLSWNVIKTLDSVNIYDTENQELRPITEDEFNTTVMIGRLPSLTWR